MIQIRITKSTTEKGRWGIIKESQTIFLHETDEGQFFEIINAIGRISTDPRLEVVAVDYENKKIDLGPARSGKI